MKFIVSQKNSDICEIDVIDEQNMCIYTKTDEMRIFKGDLIEKLNDLVSEKKLEESVADSIKLFLHLKELNVTNQASDAADRKNLIGKIVSIFERTVRDPQHILAHKDKLFHIEVEGLVFEVDNLQTKTAIEQVIPSFVRRASDTCRKLLDMVMSGNSWGQIRLVAYDVRSVEPTADAHIFMHKDGYREVEFQTKDTLRFFLSLAHEFAHAVLPLANWRLTTCDAEFRTRMLEALEADIKEYHEKKHSYKGNKALIAEWIFDVPISDYPERERLAEHITFMMQAISTPELSDIANSVAPRFSKLVSEYVEYRAKFPSAEREFVRSGVDPKPDQLPPQSRSSIHMPQGRDASAAPSLGTTAAKKIPAPRTAEKISTTEASASTPTASSHRATSTPTASEIKRDTMPLPHADVSSRKLSSPDLSGRSWETKEIPPTKPVTPSTQKVDSEKNETRRVESPSSEKSRPTHVSPGASPSAQTTTHAVSSPDLSGRSGETKSNPQTRPVKPSTQKVESEKKETRRVDSSSAEKSSEKRRPTHVPSSASSSAQARQPTQQKRDRKPDQREQSRREKVQTSVKHISSTQPSSSSSSYSRRVTTGGGGFLFPEINVKGKQTANKDPYRIEPISRYLYKSPGFMRAAVAQEARAAQIRQEIRNAAADSRLRRQEFQRTISMTRAALRVEYRRNQDERRYAEARSAVRTIVGDREARLAGRKAAYSASASVFEFKLDNLRLRGSFGGYARKDPNPGKSGGQGGSQQNPKNDPPTPLMLKGLFGRTIGGVGYGQVSGGVEGLSDFIYPLLHKKINLALPFENGEQLVSIQEVEQIWNELAIGVLVNNVIPAVSIDFNNADFSLNVLINPEYEGTLIGATIASLDYRLKCFLHRFVMSNEDFERWLREHSELTSDVYAGAINLGTLFTPDARYVSLVEWLAEKNLEEYVIGEERKCRSSFRIISEPGKIETDENGSIFIVRPQFKVDYTIEPSADYQAELEKYRQDFGEYPEEWLSLHQAFREYCDEKIKKLMPTLHDCKKSFALLGVSHFLLQLLYEFKQSATVPELIPIQTEYAAFPQKLPPLPLTSTASKRYRIPVYPLLDLYELDFLHRFLRHRYEQLCAARESFSDYENLDKLLHGFEQESGSRDRIFSKLKEKLRKIVAADFVSVEENKVFHTALISLVTGAVGTYDSFKKEERIILMKNNIFQLVNDKHAIATEFAYVGKKNASRLVKFYGGCGFAFQGPILPKHSDTAEAIKKLLKHTPQAVALVNQEQYSIISLPIKPLPLSESSEYYSDLISAMPHTEIKEDFASYLEKIYQQDVAAVTAEFNEAFIDLRDDSGFSILHHAVISENYDIVRFIFLKNKNLLKAQDQFGQTPLHLAAFLGLNTIITLFFLLGSTELRKAINIQTTAGATAIFQAAVNGKSLTLDTLLQFQYSESHKPLHNGISPFLAAVSAAQEACALKFLTGKISEAVLGDIDDAIFPACARNLFRLVARILQIDPHLRNAKKENDLSALHVATQCKAMDVLKLLLENQADPNISSINGETPLHVAAKLGDREATKLLLDHHALPDKKDEHGKTPIIAALEHGQLALVDDLLPYGAEGVSETAAKYGAFHLSLKTLAIEGRSALEEDSDGFSILDRCALHQDEDYFEAFHETLTAEQKQTESHLDVKIIYALIHHGLTKEMNIGFPGTPEEIDQAMKIVGETLPTFLESLVTNTYKKSTDEIMNAWKTLEFLSQLFPECTHFVDDDGKSLLHHAAENGQIAMMNWCAYNMTDVNAADKDGLTPFHYLAKNQGPLVARQFISHGGDYQIKDLKLGSTPAHIAIIHGNIELFEFFTSLGINLEDDSSQYGSVIDAAFLGQTDRSIHYLQSRGLITEKTLHSEKAIINSIAADNSEYLEKLKPFGFYKDYIFSDGSTPIENAARLNKNKVIAYLIENGAFVDFNALSANNPLEIVINNGNVNATLLLLNKLFEEENPEKEAEIFLLAAASGHVAIVKLMIELGMLTHQENAESEDALTLAKKFTPLAVPHLIEAGMTFKIQHRQRSKSFTFGEDKHVSLFSYRDVEEALSDCFASERARYAAD